MASRATEATPEIIEVIVKIPAEAMPIIEAAAEMNGWMKRLPATPENPEGLDNPVNPILIILGMTIRNTKAQAVQRVAQDRSRIVYQQTEVELSEIADRWLKINQAQGA